MAKKTDSSVVFNRAKLGLPDEAEERVVRYWQGRKVLITGGKGFLGRYVGQRLRELGAMVFDPGHSVYDYRFLYDAQVVVSEVKPDVVIHLAANVAGIGGNLATPASMFYDNLGMGLNVLEVCGKMKVPKLIMLGTVCSYPARPGIPFMEDDIWNGYPESSNASYGIAKRALLQGCVAYRSQHNLNAIYLVPTNLYGPGMNIDPLSSHVIPAIIRKVYEAQVSGEKSVNLWGNGKATRDFLYVDECARAITYAGARYNKPDPLNIGSGLEISIKDTATLITASMGYAGDIMWDKSKPNGQWRRVLDTAKAASLIGFMDEVPLSAGLAALIDWEIGLLKNGK